MKTDFIIDGLDADQWYDHCQTYQHNGHNIKYRVGGNGTPLLLIHGFPTSSLDWQPIWRELCKRYRVIAPDLIGFGHSDKPSDYFYKLKDQTDICQGLLLELGYRHFHVLCHDYGVSVGQEFLARHNSGDQPYQVKSLCFLNGGIFPEMHRPILTQILLRSPVGPVVSRLISKRGFSRSFASVFGATTQPSKQELDTFYQVVKHNGGKKIFHKLICYIDDRKFNRDRWVNALLDTAIPVRLINGNLDPVSGKHLSDYYRTNVPNADVIDLVDIGHYPQVEAPKEVLQHYLIFRERLKNDR